MCCLKHLTHAPISRVSAVCSFSLTVMNGPRFLCVGGVLATSLIPVISSCFRFLAWEAGEGCESWRCSAFVAFGKDKIGLSDIGIKGTNSFVSNTGCGPECRSKAVGCGCGTKLPSSEFWPRAGKFETR